MFGSQTDFELQSMTCINVRTAQKLNLILTLCYRPDTHPFNPLYPCEIIMKQLYLISCMTETKGVFIKYSQNYSEQTRGSKLLQQRMWSESTSKIRFDF